ncbi:uncharacterized protein [Chironomus tepperi]|uniref:uncharacterized protein isoform X1 n=1 Tax=Chironomus tepperi TaxID=113505 RepID=UPI00391EF88E
MCKCCQLCLEDLYWQCCEEKYCYDESIANYDPAEDDHYRRSNGHVANGGEYLNNNNEPITVQPARLQRNVSINSAKIHEDDVRREIQTANVNLPPEIVQVFANSQIFHDHKPLKSKSSQQQPATFSIGVVKIEKSKLEQINEEGSNKLLLRLEQADENSSKSDIQRTKRATVSSTPPKIVETPAIKEEENEDEADSEVILRPNRLKSTTTSQISAEEVWPSKPVNKRLQLDAPYFTQRPASENDISIISPPKQDRTSTIPTVSSSSDYDFRFSMTPEVPSISFAQLPKNYLDTPSIEKFKKHEPTLQEIQTAGLQSSQIDFSMPRYYGKSDMILNRTSFDVIGSGSNSSIASAVSVSMNTKKLVDKSKRLKHMRAHLPPLMIHKDKNEKEK